MHASVNYGVCLSLDVIYTFYFFMKKKKSLKLGELSWYFLPGCCKYLSRQGYVLLILF